MTYKNEPFSEFLTQSMAAAGLTNQQVAERFGVSSQAVSQWKSGKNRPKSSVLDLVRDYLRQQVENATSVIPSSKLGSKLANSDLVQIPQYDIEASAGPGLEVPDYQNSSKIWTIPREALSGIRVTSLKNLAIITVRGESMEPDYMPGEHILIDLGDKTVTHDGAYVLWNSYGLVIKLVQLLPATSTSGPMLRIISKNTDFPPYEMSVTDVQISGRVVGKWVWK